MTNSVWNEGKCTTGWLNQQHKPFNVGSLHGWKKQTGLVIRWVATYASATFRHRVYLGRFNMVTRERRGKYAGDLRVVGFNLISVFLRDPEFHTAIFFSFCSPMMWKSTHHFCFQFGKHTWCFSWIRAAPCWEPECGVPLWLQECDNALIKSRIICERCVRIVSMREASEEAINCLSY